MSIGWSYLIIEGHCGRKWSCKKDKYHYRVDNIEDIGSKKNKVRNKNYDKNYKTPRKPKYCKNRISFDCIECKHFAYSDADKRVYKLIEEIE